MMSSVLVTLPPFSKVPEVPLGIENSILSLDNQPSQPHLRTERHIVIQPMASPATTAIRATVVI